MGVQNIRFVIFIAILILSLSTLKGEARATDETPDLPLQSRYIVVCNPALIDVTGCAARAHATGAEVLKSLPLIHGVAIVLPPHVPAEAVVRFSGILRIDPDTIHQVLGETFTWNIDRINADLAWEAVTSGNTVRVGVLDTGIDPNHPDLLANIAGGFDTIRHRDWADGNGHGTHVAGIVAAARNNNIGVIGGAPESRLYAVKVLSNAGFGYTSDIIEGIGWCIRNGCQVINMSLGSTAYNQSFQDAVTAAYQAGIVIVAAAGNSGSSVPNYPAAYDHVAGVSATDTNDQAASWSNYGSYVDFSAPGVGIYSTYKKKSYASLSGTSMATPHISALAALRISEYVALGLPYTPDQIVADLIASARDLGTSGWDASYGYGMPDALELVNLPLQ